MKTWSVKFTYTSGKLIYKKVIETYGGRKSAINMAKDHKLLPTSSNYYVRAVQVPKNNFNT
jgi:hypothetical protein